MQENRDLGEYGMKEAKIEESLKSNFEKLGGKVLKFNSSSMNGLPDRIVLLPGGIIFFAELKAPGKKARPLQIMAHRMLRKLGFDVYVIDTKEGVKDIVGIYTARLSKDGD